METLETPEAATPTPRWKIALIPLLAATLVWNLSTSNGSHGGSEAEESAANTDSGPGDFSAERGHPPVEKAQPWPEFPLERIVARDPFAMSGELLARTEDSAAQVVATTSTDDFNQPEKTRGSLEELSASNPVTAVIDGPLGRAAIVDSKVVHIGDVLEDRFRIVDILKSGIVVELTDQD